MIYSEIPFKYSFKIQKYKYAHFCALNGGGKMSDDNLYDGSCEIVSALNLLSGR